MGKYKVWYYLFGGSSYGISFINPESKFNTCEFIIVRESHATPERIWVRLRNNRDDPEWSKVPGESFVWWWSWFKTIQHSAVKSEELTEEELFERIGLELL